MNKTSSAHIADITVMAKACFAIHQTFGRHQMEIKQLPYSETTQNMLKLIQDAQQSIADVMLLKNPNPRIDQIQQFRIDLENQMRGQYQAYLKAVQLECPGILISISDDELKVRGITREEFYSSLNVPKSEDGS